MQYPLIGRHVLSGLRLFHGAFGLLVTILFFYQGTAGIKIRLARKSGKPLPFHLQKRHRKAGPVLAVLGIVGFFTGVTLVLLDTGNALEYPAHFAVGCLTALLIIAGVMSSRGTAGKNSPLRTPHFVIGAGLLIFYLVQVFLGIGVLF